MAKKTGKRLDPREGTVKQCIDDAMAEFECLKGNMEDWKDNLDSNNMGHLPKYDEVCECIDELDSAMNAIEGVWNDSLPSEVYELPVLYNVDTRKRRKSRSDCFGESLSIFERALCAMRRWFEEKEKLPENEKAVIKDRIASVETVIAEFDTAMDYFSDVSFPGMY